MNNETIVLNLYIFPIGMMMCCSYQKESRLKVILSTCDYLCKIKLILILVVKWLPLQPWNNTKSPQCVLDKSRPVLGAVFSKHNKGFNFLLCIIIFRNDIQYLTTCVQIPRKTSVALKRDRHIPTG